MLYLIIIAAFILVVLVVVFSKKKSPGESRGATLDSILKDSYPNRSYKEIIELAFYNAKELLESLPRYRGNDIEILAFLSRIGNVTVQWVGGDIYKYKTEVDEYVDSVISKDEKKLYLKREGFYWDISYGGKIAGLWSTSDIPPSIQSVPMLRCAVAFGDCVTNPDMINDYEDAPLIIDGIDEVVEFQQRFMNDFFRLVHTYCVMLAGKEFDPPILKEYE